MTKIQTKPQLSLFPSLKQNKIGITYRGNFIFSIQRESFFKLHSNLKIEKGLKKKNQTSKKMDGNGIVQCIKNNEQNKISFRELKSIFKNKLLDENFNEFIEIFGDENTDKLKDVFEDDSWIFVLADSAKIDTDFNKLNDDINAYGSIRGEDALPINELQKYLAKNIINEGVPNIPLKTVDIEKDAVRMRKYLEFNIQEYRQKYRKNKYDAVDYLIKKIDDKSIYTFKTYDIHGVMPMNIGDIQFDGMTTTTSEGNIAISISTKRVPERRVTTCIALLYTLMSNTINENRKDNLIAKIKPADYNFVGNFLLQKNEINTLREIEFNSWNELRNEANKLGISIEYLHNFLFLRHDRNKWKFLNNDKPEDYSEYIGKQQGGPNWKYKEAFTRFYSSNLFNVKIGKAKETPKVINMMAETMISRGGNKEKQSAFKKLIY